MTLAVVKLKKTPQTQKTKLQTMIEQNTLSSHVMTVVKQNQVWIPNNERIRLG